MTPLAYADKYRNMDILMMPLEERVTGKERFSTGGKWKRIKVAAYRLLPSEYLQTFWNSIAKHIGKQGLAVMVKTIDGNVDTRVFPSWLDLWLHFQHPFQGKGTPEQVQLAIQLLYRFHKTSEAFKDVNAFVAKPFLGLDCNGFVGNYIQNGRSRGNPWWRASNLMEPGPNTYIERLLRLPANKVLSSMDEIKPDGKETYILAFCTPTGQVIDRIKSVDANGNEVETIGHIMITEPGTVRAHGDELEVRVVESTGSKGLVDSIYKIKSVTRAMDRANEGVFKVFRGVSSSNMNVKISRLG